MSLPSFSLSRPVFATVCSIAIIVFGVIGFKFLGIREYPAIDPPVITVSTVYTGADADIIESQITEPLEKAINGIESIKTISRTDDTVEAVSKEVKVYTEQDHLNKVDFETRELYEQFKIRLLNMDDNITMQPKKQVIGFNVDNNIFCDIVIQSKGLKIYLNLKSGELQDQKNISRDISNVGHWGNGAYEIKLNDLEDIDYILSLLKQSIRKNKK